MRSVPMQERGNEVFNSITSTDTAHHQKEVPSALG